MMKTEKIKGGTRRIGDVPDSKSKFCRHPEHNPPGHQVLEPGQYEHTCPGCGNVMRFFIREKFWMSSKDVESSYKTCSL